MTERWYVFCAYNSQKIYGYGTAAEADQYADIVNEGRTGNIYAVYPVDGDDSTLHVLADGIDLGDELAALASDSSNSRPA
jgi:hypothetical protein